MITIDDFIKVELKVGTIISAEEIEGSDKLLKLKVDFGPKVSEQNEDPEVSTEKPVGEEDEVIEANEGNEDSGQARMTDISEEDQNDVRQVLSGIKTWYTPEDLIGKQFVFCTNLQPRKMMGMESQAMIMAAEGEDKPIPLTVGTPVPNGAKIR